MAQDVDVINEFAGQMEPKDGCLTIIKSLDKNAASITAFTHQALDTLEDLINK